MKNLLLAALLLAAPMLGQETPFIVQKSDLMTLKSGPVVSGGGGVSDGDKGDIVVSGSGSVWLIDANVTLTTPAIGNGSISGGCFKLNEDTDNGVNYIQICGQDSLPGNRIYTFPDVGGDAEVDLVGPSVIRVWDDYVCGATGGGATNVGSCVGMTGQATGNGAMSQNTGSIDADHIGIAQASTAGQAAGGGHVVATAATGVWTLTGNERVTGLFKLSALSTNADAYTVRAGILDVASSAPTEGCFFSYTNIGSTPNWMMNAQKTSGGAGLTSVDSTVAVTTNWTKLRVSYDGSQCHFFIDGTEAPNSPIANTNVPTAATSWGWGIVAGGGDGTTGTVTLRTDYLEFLKTGLSR